MPPREEYLRSPTRSGGCNSRRGHRSHRNHNNMEALSPSSLSSSASDSSSFSPQIRRLRRRPSMPRRRTPRTHNTKSVSFAMIQVDDIHEVYHWTEYSSQEKASVWYDQSDYKQFKDDCKHSVDAYGMLSPMSKKSAEDDSISATASSAAAGVDDQTEDCCTRGIERMTKECSCNYYQRRMDVLKEVRWFKYSGRCSFEEQELMARQVSQLTSASVLEAQDRAQQDEEFAIEYLKDVVSAIMMEERRNSRSSGGHHHQGKKLATAATTSSPTRQHRGCTTTTSNLAVTTTPPQDEEGEGSTSTYYCALPVLSSPASSSTKKKRSNSPNVKSKRMLRAHATKLFREESLLRLSFEGL